MRKIAFLLNVLMCEIKKLLFLYVLQSIHENDALWAILEANTLNINDLSGLMRSESKLFLHKQSIFK